MGGFMEADCWLIPDGVVPIRIVVVSLLSSLASWSPEEASFWDQLIQLVPEKGP